MVAAKATMRDLQDLLARFDQEPSVECAGHLARLVQKDQTQSVRVTAMKELPRIVNILTKPAVDALMTVHRDLGELHSSRMLAADALSSIGIATTNDSDARKESGQQTMPLLDAAANACGSSRDPGEWDKPELPECDGKGPSLLPPGHRLPDVDTTQAKFKKFKGPVAWTPLVPV